LLHEYYQAPLVLIFLVTNNFSVKDNEPQNIHLPLVQ